MKPVYVVRLLGVIRAKFMQTLIILISPIVSIAVQLRAILT